MPLNFLKKEGIQGTNLFNPLAWGRMLWKHNIIQFLLVGGTGLIIQLLTTWLLTTFLFTLSTYYIGYSIGLGLNLIYNFIMHSNFTFKTKKNHSKRFTKFIIYSFSMALFQYVLVRSLVYLIGETWYLVIITSVIFVFSIITYIIFKFWLFKDKRMMVKQ